MHTLMLVRNGTCGVFSDGGDALADDEFKEGDLQEKPKQRWFSMLTVILNMFGTAVLTRLMLMVPLPRSG